MTIPALLLPIVARCLGFASRDQNIRLDDELISLPEDGVSDGVLLPEADEPMQPLAFSAPPPPGGGMQPTRTRTIQGWRETAEL